MWSRAELKERAKEVFASCRWMAVAVSLILVIVSGGGSGGGGSNGNYSGSDLNSGNMSDKDIALIFTVLVAVLVVALIFIAIRFVIKTFVSNPIEIGARRFFMISRERTADFRELAFIFSNGYIKNAIIMLLRDIFISLWSILFVIPGIIKSYEYRMIPYILAENPEIDRKTAFELSKRMMDGQKWDTFVLDLSFIPWVLLSLITCGIVAVVYYFPYYNLTNAELYAVLRNELIMNDKEAAGLLIGFGE
ncbi:MAG: DUF975 family protein [Lachnospiraceae bacterium]|nr:DUF975 family protein [Lachnospiraceae bacterium]